MNCVVEDGGGGVADQGRKEDEGDYHKGEVVVFLELGGRKDNVS
jgi:hypothetical protein